MATYATPWTWGLRLRRGLGLMAGLLLLLPVSASAQAVTSYETTFAKIDADTVPIGAPLVFPAASVTCVEGRAAAAPTTTTWIKAGAPFTMQFEPDTTHVCTVTAPATQTALFLPGQIYRATMVAIDEVGGRSDPGTSNPFGVAGKPPTILRVVVGK